MWLTEVTYHRGEAHLETKPRHHADNSPNPPEVPGDWGSRGRRESDIGGEGRVDIGVHRETRHQDPHPHPQEVRTSGRSATRLLKVGQRQRRKRTMRKMRKGTGTKRP